MFRELGRDMRGDLEDSKERPYRSTIEGYALHVYIIRHKDEYFLVFDPGYEDGNIYIYKQVEAIPIAKLKEEFTGNRQFLIYSFIKKRFWKEPDLIYTCKQL